MSGGSVGATMLAQTLRLAVPYVCVALGGVWSERSGVVNIALEGVLLAGGLGAVAAHLATGSAWAGVAAAALVGAGIGAGHALVVVRGRVDAIVSGLAINLVAMGGTRFLTRALYGSSSNSPAVEGFRASAGTGPLVRVLCDPLGLLALSLVVGTIWTLQRTRFGLRARACGESPRAAAGAGIDVAGLRLAAVSLGCAMCALGGAALAYDNQGFQSGMSGGRGFIALAIVILAGWRPGRAALACVAFAALDVVQIALQDRAGGPGQSAQMLPYTAALAALWAIARRRGGDAGPAGLRQAVE